MLTLIGTKSKRIRLLPDGHLFIEDASVYEIDKREVMKRLARDMRQNVCFLWNFESYDTGGD